MLLKKSAACQRRATIESRGNLLNRTCAFSVCLESILLGGPLKIFSTASTQSRHPATILCAAGARVNNSLGEGHRDRSVDQGWLAQPWFAGSCYAFSFNVHCSRTMYASAGYPRKAITSRQSIARRSNFASGEH